MSVRTLAVMAALALGLMLGGCFTQTYQRGYVLADGALEQIPLGAPQEQVLITLGTPSTVATVSGEVFYYISARTEQTSFLPEKTVDQRVVAVYFDKNRRVQRIANYGLAGRQDLRLRVSRTTPTSGPGALLPDLRVQDFRQVAEAMRALGLRAVPHPGDHRPTTMWGRNA